MPINYRNSVSRAQAIAVTSYMPMVVRKPVVAKPQPATPPPKLRPVTDFKMDYRVSVIEQIVAEVAHRYGLTSAQLKEHKRQRNIVWARQDAMFEVYRRVKISYPKLGHFFDRDHTTVMHSINKAEERHWIKQAIYKALEGRLNVVLDDWDDHPAAQRIPAADVDTSLRSVRSSLLRDRKKTTQVTD